MGTVSLFRIPLSTNMTVEQALHSAVVDAKDGNIQDVMIIGYDENGGLYIRSSELNCAQAMFMANKAFRWAESGGEF